MKPKKGEKCLHPDDISRTMALINVRSAPEENNNITIYNGGAICEWQSGIIAHVTFIVLCLLVHISDMQ